MSKVATQSKSFGRKGKNLALDDVINGDAVDGTREGIVVVFVVAVVDVKKLGHTFGFADHTHQSAHNHDTGASNTRKKEK